MNTTQGNSSPPTFDGLHLVGIAGELAVTPRPVRGAIPLADGLYREQLLAPLTGLPQITVRHAFSLEWSHVSQHEEALEARLGIPGPHQLCLWKHTTLVYRGDGSSAEFVLPWRHAPHVLTPPLGRPLSHFPPSLRIGLDTVALAVDEVSADTYDGDPPDETTVWFNKEEALFKVLTPPLAGQPVIARIVPVHRVIVAAADEQRRYTGPVREPRRLELVEAA